MEVSRSTIQIADVAMPSRAGRRSLPYVIMHPIPRLREKKAWPSAAGEDADVGELRQIRAEIVRETRRLRRAG